MAGIPTKHIKVGRVLNEDNRSLTLEILKDDNEAYTLNQGLDPEAEPDRFFLLIFVHQVDDYVETWLPWESN